MARIPITYGEVKVDVILPLIHLREKLGALNAEVQRCWFKALRPMFIFWGNKPVYTCPLYFQLFIKNSNNF